MLSDAPNLRQFPTASAASKPDSPKISVRSFTVSFAGKEVLRDINLDINPCQRLAIIGPSGSGKSTFLRSLNRLNDLEFGFAARGTILLDGQDINHGDMDVSTLRRRVGIVHSVPIPLPWSIYDNLAYGPRLAGMHNPKQLDAIVETALQNSFLWDEVKDRLKEPAYNLSGGQQQRLCLARALTLEPEVLLLDEPCSGLDPISTAKIEDALDKLKSRYAIVLVTNNTMQAARASDYTAFFFEGYIVEYGETERIFTKPVNKKTEDYITGRFG
ncbi:MAG: phosphate ABC transporter ATP-binding protein [Pseudomonadota bacterium]